MQIIKSTFPAINWSILIGIAFVLLLSGCGQIAEMDSHSMISRFQKAESLYRASMRWGNWTSIFQLIKNQPATETTATSKQSTTLSPPTEELLSHLETIKVKEIKILSSGINDKDNTAHSRFEIVYRSTSSIKVHTIRHSLHWWYHDESNNWFTDTPLPKEFQLPKSNTDSRTIKLSPRRF